MSRLNSRTRLPVLALAGLLQLQVASVSAKTKPDAGATAVQEEDQGDACLQDGLCRAHYTRARGLSKEGNYAGALAAYEAAYRRRPVPWLLINIGRTLHKLGRPAEALPYYQRYREADQAPAPERLKLLAEYEQQAEADRRGVAGPPVLDKPGERLPPPPTMPAEPSGGPLPPSSASPGAGAADLPSTMSPGGNKPEAPAGTPTLTWPLVSDPGPEEPRLQRRPTWPGKGLWIGLGVTGGLLLAGTALGITAQVSATQLHNTPYVGATPGADVLALQERTSRTALAADVLFASTAVALGITLIATLTNKPAARSTPPAAEPVPAAPRRPPPTPPGPPAAGPGPESPAGAELLSITGEVPSASRPAVPGPLAPPPTPDAPGEAPKEAPAAGSP